jgi:tetratricopeptide (TPR) repeat protein
MKTDSFGLPVSTDKQVVIDALDHFATQLLLNGTSAGKVIDAVKAHPDSLLLNCHSGILFLYTHDDADSAKTLPYLKAAEKSLNNSNHREKLHYQAACAWYAKDHDAAIAIYEKITQQWPRDCVAAKFAEWLFYCAGQPYYADRFLQMTTPMYAHNKNEPGFLAIHSFALELTQHYDQSLGIAEDALTLEPITPWAHHTVAHALMAKSDISRGIKMLETYKPTWEKILPPLAGHLNWHLTLFYLANLDEKNILTRFSPDVWGHMPEVSLEQIDAVSLLWRMEMADMPHDDLLNKVTEKLGPHVYQHYIGFDTAHYVYALSRMGNIEATEKIIREAIDYAHTLQPSYKNIWLNICVPLFKGTYAFAQKHYKEACTHLTPILPLIAAVGGSDAQIELFYQTAAISLLRAGQKDKAQAVIKQYLPYYIPTKLGEKWSNS